MKTMYDLSKEIQDGIVETYNKHGLDAICNELSDRFTRMKDEILVAWFAEHGFAPGKAEFVEDRTGGTVRYYVREADQASHYTDLLEKADAAVEAWRDNCECECNGKVFLAMEELSSAVVAANKH